MSKIKQTKAPSFADIAVIDRRNKMRNPFLSQINQLVDWRPISNLLNKRFSDREVEERINDSISWSDFLELDLTKASPDHSTICRFRQELVDKGLMEKLFKLYINVSLAVPLHAEGTH
ncbi:transposase [Porphyromonas sp.]